MLPAIRLERQVDEHAQDADSPGCESRVPENAAEEETLTPSRKKPMRAGDVDESAA
jgi:hypothetical protein